jgi:hypothetical protein
MWSALGMFLARMPLMSLALIRKNACWFVVGCLVCCGGRASDLGKSAIDGGGAMGPAAVAIGGATSGGTERAVDAGGRQCLPFVCFPGVTGDPECPLHRDELGSQACGKLGTRCVYCEPTGSNACTEPPFQFEFDCCASGWVEQLPGSGSPCSLEPGDASGGAAGESSNDSGAAGG